MSFDRTFKIIVFGDAGTGKTTLTHRFLTNLFLPNATSSIGVDFQLKMVEIEDKIIKLQVWDFAGEERFRFLFPTYLKGASGGIFMYDLTNYASLAHVDDWFYIIKKEKAAEKFPVVFVGGKTDLTHLKEVSTKKAMNVAKIKHAEAYIECSSKTGENVSRVFQILAQRILENVQKDEGQ